MSASYSSRLKHYPNKGVCGLPEAYDSPRVTTVKLRKLTELMQSSRRIVVLTGAGISTSAGIPDFRGPKGIWTVEQENERGKQRPKRKRRKTENNDSSDDTNQKAASAAAMDFAKAQPTFTHKALTKLASEGIISFLITQNVDGLHRRSGLSRNVHAVLHGCCFTEKCESCHAECFRDFESGGMSFQKTGRNCPICNASLRDTLLDWEDPLPEADLDRAMAECEAADLVLCLGTSLRIEPAGSLPEYAKKFVIVNLQVTPKDDKAALIIRRRVDEVMRHVLDSLGYSDFDDAAPNTCAIERLWQPVESRAKDSGDSKVYTHSNGEKVKSPIEEVWGSLTAPVSTGDTDET